MLTNGDESILPPKKRQKTIRTIITDIPLDCACVILEFCTLRDVQCVFQSHPFFRQLLYNSEQWMNRTTVLALVKRLVLEKCKPIDKTDIQYIERMNKSMETTINLMNCQMLTPYIQFKVKKWYGRQFPKGIPKLRIEHAKPNNSGKVFKWDVKIWLDPLGMTMVLFSNVLESDETCMLLNTSWTDHIGGCSQFKLENQYIGGSGGAFETLLEVTKGITVSCSLVGDEDSTHLWFNYLKSKLNFTGKEEDAFEFALNLMSMFEWERIVGEFSESNFWNYVTGAYGNKPTGLHKNGDVWSTDHFNPLFYVSKYEESVLSQFNVQHIPSSQVYSGPQ